MTGPGLGCLDPRRDAVVLIAHGSVDELDDLPELLTNIRRGHPPPAELLAEVRRRYEEVGGSPLNGINRDIARRLEERLGVRVRTANRLFCPYPKDVVRDLAAEGIERIVTLPLAQHSAAIYGEAVKQAVREAGLTLTVLAARNWGRTRELTEAFARSIVQTVAAAPTSERSHTALLMTAHSLPISVIQSGDAYESELRASAQDVFARVEELAPHAFAHHAVAFQSQGMSTGPGGRPVAWLGPDLRTSLAEQAARGFDVVVIAPIGFLADHVEILYDLDIEARGWAKELGITLRRSESLNSGDALLEALVVVATRVLEEGAPEGH